MTQKTILCYGDSNTWGYVPNVCDSPLRKRYERHERWPGILQTLLGDGYYVIEEGLNSRTTNLGYAIPPDRNGKTYLPSCLYSHAPLDLVILALGANDAKACFNRSALQIKEGLAELIDIIQTSQYGPALQAPPAILIIPPPLPSPSTENAIDENGNYFFTGAVQKIEMLPRLYEQLAKGKGCFYLDLSDIKPSQIDGIHYDKIAHQQCAKRISKKISEIL